MLATEILTQDHGDALRLIEQLEGVRNDEPGNQDAFAQLDSALLLLMREEDEIYYPALAEYEEFAERIDENINEHETVKQNLDQMRDLSVTDETFQSLLTETKAALEAHMKTEEDDVFPRSIELLGNEKINELGNQIDQIKGDTGLSRSAKI
jgi:iron-sulfur cluster repair protein YtfE (RIC family)